MARWSITLSLTLAVALAGAAQAQTTLRLGHEDPPGGLRHQAAQMFADKVKAATNGRYIVEAHHSSTLGSGPKLLEQIKLGAIDFATTGAGIYSNQVPELTLLTLPYLVETFQQGWELYDNAPWVHEWFAKAQSKNIRILATWEAGFRQLTAKRPVHTPEDIKGEKIRIASNQVYIWLWSGYGANPTVIPFGETYLALQQGVVDAQENPVPTIHVAKFYEVAKYISLTNHIYSPIPFSMSERRYQSMSAADRKAVEIAAREVADWHRKAVVAEESQMLDDMKAKGATIIKPDVGAFARLAASTNEKAAEKFPAVVLQGLLKDAAAIKAKFPTN
jgi:tripartite ATP-independent transporter DctP family solute receptor